MIHLRLRTEYNFRRVFGRIERVLLMAQGKACAITDAGTWGHVAFAKAAKKVGKRPIFGVEVPVVDDTKKRVKDYGTSMVLLAKNDEGLAEIYRVMSLANSPDVFFHFPRLSYSDINSLSQNVIILSGTWPNLRSLYLRDNVYLEVSPSSHGWTAEAIAHKHQLVVTADNYYPGAQDRGAYELMVDRAQSRTSIMHIPDEYELRNALPDVPDEAFTNSDKIAALCKAKLPKAENVRYLDPVPLMEQCRLGAKVRKLKIVEWGGVLEPTHQKDWRFELDEYEVRLMRELTMIKEKGFEDYFYVISDLVAAAKKVMLVGPARGSSAGSLVCYLLGITDVDPIVHDLMFERFIDITRADLPDIDIDFQDTKRDLVMKYLTKKYGDDRVGRIGTVLRAKTKTCLGLTAKKIGVPPWELNDLKGAVIERSGGDARAQFCIQDAFESLDVGKAVLEKYPAMRWAAALEAHAMTSGTHAAGLVVTNESIRKYGTIDRGGTIQMDKKDAETINLLKIDALGLRTLTVIQDCLDQIGKEREWLVTYPLDDTEAFAVFNANRFAGIFQFEGYALQSLTRHMKIRNFYDIVCITALARPGPLHCGAATEFIERRIGEVEVTYMHPLAEPLTADTYGTVIYQEQVMAIGRVIGQLSWEDVSELRKAMSRSLGDEFFSKYWVKFEAGAAQQGITTIEAKAIWEKICTFGSWAFNKSHAVSYGLVSYWCAVLKAHWPLEYAAACLRNAKDEEQTIHLLREIKREGYDFTPVNPSLSELTWAVKDGTLLGGLTNVKGIGLSKAREIIAARQSGVELKPGVRRLLADAKTPYDDVFEGERRFGDFYRNPRAHNIDSMPVSYLKDVQADGEYVIIAKMKVKNLRDLNEYGNVVKRGGRRIEKNNLFLNLTLEDDTSSIIGTIGRFEYQRYGKPIVETGHEGDWFIFRGEVKNNKRKLYIKKVRKLQ